MKVVLMNCISSHDANVEACLRQILGMGKIPVAITGSSNVNTLFMRIGAHQCTFAAHWVSWADCVRMVKERHPPIANMMIHHLQEGAGPSFLSVRACTQRLVEAGFDMGFLGRSCRRHLQLCRKMLSPINRRPGGNKRQQSWRRGSSETRCGPHWTTHRELCCNLSTGLWHRHPSRHCSFQG